jgi:hypothetical protein
MSQTRRVAVRSFRTRSLLAVALTALLGTAFATSAQAATITDDTFAGGTPGSDTVVSGVGGGELLLKPALIEEFGGAPTLPTGWAAVAGSPCQ